MADKSTSVEELWRGIIRPFTSDLNTSNTLEHIQMLALELHSRALPLVDEYRKLFEADYKEMYGKSGEKQAENALVSGSG